MKTTIKAILIITAFAFFSCDKTVTNEVTDLTGTDLSATQLKSATLSVNDVAVESVADEASFEIEFYAGYEQMLRQLAHVKGEKGNLLMGQGHFHYVEGQLPSVSVETPVDQEYPIIITINYGDGIKTNHDHLISGKVTIEISAPKNTNGSTRTIFYDNCAIDAIGVTGTVTETFISTDATNQTITCDSDVTFTLADGTVIDWVGNNDREWLKGLDTPKERDDDQIKITGTVIVISTKSDGTIDNYSRVITESLIRLGDCNHPVSGIVEFNKIVAETTTKLATLDYGDGTCDNLATLTTADGTIIEIEFKGEGKMPKAKTEGQHKGKMNGNGHKGGMSGGMNGGH